ncbi:hypothetical protein BU24DRAFT_144073 [Aaosphaeria arxii CBS 175.79]|uniref:Secreted protein n=1 Tax=Aaosphaeria arxii CBS 175.79 TaxID=1450172 RepID=A0A6A5XUW4_9PLEO|nr:uncharacterized protein BU24DRAFT_144073 [Aaosphaeria arxii CBS 175.79]KAF2017135.1 hypothetical protein BU24DRAFT_144073 [Aaosphaeria arxii CBS 175.79]
MSRIVRVLVLGGLVFEPFRVMSCNLECVPNFSKTCPATGMQLALLTVSPFHYGGKVRVLAPVGPIPGTFARIIWTAKRGDLNELAVLASCFRH